MLLVYMIKKKKPGKVKRVRKFTSPLFGRSKKKISAKNIKKANKCRRHSSLELQVYKWLEEEGIKFRKEKAIGRCHVDIFIEPNIVLECNGCYFHACLKCSKQNTSREKQIRMRDVKRYAFFRSRGYEVHTVKECDVKKDPKKIKEQLRLLAKGL
jgi:G:T-mismatch repair DNA endonuclease (very short patch repair protein)